MGRDSSRLKLFLSLLVISTPPLFSAASPVTVSGRRLLVKGQPFTVQGVDYSPVPVGSTAGSASGGCTGPYLWWADRSTYIADFPLIKRMGANTIRAYGILNDASANTVSQVRAALDSAQAQGLYVIMNFYPDHFVSVPANAAAWRAQFLAGINAYKDHPAVLLWEFGNEQNLDNGQDPAWYPLVNAAAGDAHAADPNHSVMTVEGECPTCGTPINFNIGSLSRSADDPHMPNLDAWGVNAYRGTSFQGLFETLISSTSKPLLVTEFGKDAYRDSTAQEDQAMQASYIASQWQEIAARRSAADPTKPLAGGVVFEWTDEWWKAGSCLSHDTTVLFARSGDTVDPNYQEEWFGLTAVSPVNAISNPAGTARTLRTSYATLQGYWNPTATASTAAAGIFDGPVRNFPNPFRVGSGNTLFVANVTMAAKVDVKIFDAGDQFVGSLTQSSTGPGRVELLWDGRNGQGAFVSPGLYLVRIEGTATGKEEKQFRRVVAVK